MTEWIKITDRPPAESGQYIVFLKVWDRHCKKFFPRIKVARFNRGTSHKNPHFYGNQSFSASDISHWMPLPEMPKEEET